MIKKLKWRSESNELDLGLPDWIEEMGESSHLGSYIVESLNKITYRIYITIYRNNEYYFILYPDKTYKRPIMQAFEIIGEKLLWTYPKGKTSKKLNSAGEFFIAQFGSLTLNFEIPHNEPELENLLRLLDKLIIVRKEANIIKKE
jgi:hypothetical protein